MESTSIGRRGLAGGNDHLLLFVGLPRVESMSIPVVNSKGANENGRAGRRINVKTSRSESVKTAPSCTLPCERALSGRGQERRRDEGESSRERITLF